MAPIMHPEIAEALEDALAPLPGITSRQMFGCKAFFVQREVFAALWPPDRIALKLPDPDAYESVVALPGAARWAPNGSAMRSWVLVPPNFIDLPEHLAEWVGHAHEWAVDTPPRAID